MAIKKAKAHHHNGTGFETIHYETQAHQVKVMSGETILTDLGTLLLEGVSKSGVDIATIKQAGVYKIKNMTGTKPFTMTSDVEYPLIVQVAGSTVIQTVVNHSDGGFHSRVIQGTTVKPFFTYGSVDDLSTVESKIGSMSGLDTATKSTLVGAINEVLSDLTALEMGVEDLESQLITVQNTLGTHKHDADYLKLTGGKLNGNLVLGKGKVLEIEDNANLPLDTVRVDSSNRVAFGVATNHSVLHSKDGLLQVWDGTKMSKLMTDNNGGHGSGFDADKLDGIEGSDFVRKSVANVLNGDMTIGSGKSMILQASSGSSQAGSLFFKDGTGATKARIKAEVDGDIVLSAGNYDNFKVKANGETETYHSHVLLSTNRNVAILFKDNAQDAGAGMYMNYDGRFGIWDWKRNEEYVFFDRSTGRSKFKHAVEIQGNRLSIQSSAPSSPSSGDVWVQI